MLQITFNWDEHKFPRARNARELYYLKHAYEMIFIVSEVLQNISANNLLYYGYYGPYSLLHHMLADVK